MTFPAYLFDLDGTLVDSAADIAAAANHALASLDLGPVSVTQVRGWIGRGSRILLRDALSFLDYQDATHPEDIDATVERIVPLFVRYSEQHVCDHCTIFEQVPETLAALKSRGSKLAVVTNKFEGLARQLLDDIGLADHLDVIVGADSTPHPKPHPAPVLSACEQLNVSTADALMVGDSKNDVLAARAAECPVVCVNYGYNHGEPLSDSAPDHILSEFSELLRYRS